MIKNLIEKLNTPKAVVAVLAVILLANGILFYQSRSSTPETTEVRESPPRQNADRNATPEENASTENAEENATDSETESGPEGAEPPEEEATEEEATEEPAPEEEATEEAQASEEEAAEEEQASEETPASEEEAAEENSEQPSAGEGSEAPREVEERVLLAGLSESVGSCGGTDEEDERCIRDFVGEVSPESRYVGGRIDLATEAEGTNTEFIYFEDPALDPCEFERAEYDGEANRYAVILVGEGSFNDARGNECIPQA